MIGFDTLNLWLIGSHLKTAQNFKNPTEHLKDGKYFVSGSVGNLRASCSDSGLSLQGSFAKLLNGSNMCTLNPKELSIVVESLNDFLSVDLTKARTKRIDLATTLEMDYQPMVYYAFLGNLKGSKRLVQPSSLNYQNSQRTFKFYDKVAECLANGSPIPKELKNENLLRIENSFLNNVARQFNCTGLTVCDLMSEPFFETLKQKFVRTYSEISKISESNQFSYQTMTGKKQLQQQAILFYVENRGGLQNVLNEVEQAQRMGQLTKKQAFDLRAEYQSACNSKINKNESKLIAELTSKIQLVL